ncbi:MAG: hypothetical protein B7Z13_14610 [Caulobacterales bacterium 32-67-6]|nr:MAG: hypothetical protein B7Z13_14610 [Caulobacterales bacterium 32-67-6]
MSDGVKKPSPVLLCAVVGAGSAAGALARFQTGTQIMAHWGGGDLLATAVVNIVGSFAIMVFATLTASTGRYPVGEVARQCVMAGFCGGYTTRSLMSLSTFYLFIEGRWLEGVAYVVGVVTLSLAAATIGYWIAAILNRRTKDG